LEAFYATPLLVDELTKFSVLIGVLSTALFDRGEPLPEEFVVQVTATIEFDSREEREVSCPIVLAESVICLLLKFI